MTTRAGHAGFPDMTPRVSHAGVRVEGEDDHA